MVLIFPLESQGRLKDKNCQQNLFRYILKPTGCPLLSQTVAIQNPKGLSITISPDINN